MDPLTTLTLDEWRENESGSTLVELALVLPVFLLTLFGFFASVIALCGYCNASYACRAGVRYASLHSATSLAPASAATVQAIVAPYLWADPIGGVRVTTLWSPGVAVGGTVRVSVKLIYPVRIPFSQWKEITMGSSAVRTISR